MIDAKLLDGSKLKHVDFFLLFVLSGHAHQHCKKVQCRHDVCIQISAMMRKWTSECHLLQEKKRGDDDDDDDDEMYLIECVLRCLVDGWDLEEACSP